LYYSRADKFKYGKLIEDMKNDVICKKDPFPKTVTEACHVLSKWQKSTPNITMEKMIQMMELPSQP